MHTAAEIKEILSFPISLFILMIFGSVISMALALKDARKNGAMISVSEYFFSLETLITIGTNVIAFFALIMTDSLNFTGAVGIGFALNHLSDMRPGGRTAAVVDSIPDANK